jgi:hypothetical protein
VHGCAAYFFTFEGLEGLENKRKIFAALGKNFLVKDQTVRIEANEWLVPIEKAYPELEKEYNRLELNKNLSVEARSEAFASLITLWGDRRGSNPHRRDHNPVLYH